MKFNLTKTEIGILSMVFMLTIIGIVISWVDLNSYEYKYVNEDGFIEWLTVIGLLIGAFVSFARISRLYKSKGFLFIAFTIGLGLLMIVAAGEEISWGQRIFGIESSDFFKANNAQKETNLHNLVESGVKINRILSVSITVCLIIYMVIVPFIYHKSAEFKKFVDSKGVILPKIYQTASLVIISGMTYLIPHGKRAELLEFGMVFIFLLVVFYPMNSHIFQKDSTEK